MSINLTLRQLKAFVAASQASSFSEAAEQLGITQPSLSSTIRKMEEQLGLRLFDRTTRTLALTADGRDLAAVAEHLVRDFEKTLESLISRSSGQRGRVSVAVLPSIAAALLPGALHAFAAAYPEVEVTVRDYLQDRAISAVRDGLADFAVTTQPAVYPELTSEELGTDAFHLVCRTDHPLAGNRQTSWAEITAYPFIAMAASTSVRRFAEAGLVQADRAIRPRYEVEQIPSAVALVAAGLGVTALPELTLRMFPREGLTSVPILDPVVRRRICLVTVSGRSLSVAASFLADEIRTAFAHLRQ